MRKSLILEDDVVQEIIKGNLLSWATPLTKKDIAKVTEYCRNPLNSEPSEEDILLYGTKLDPFGEFEDIDLTPNEITPHFVSVGNCLCSRIKYATMDDKSRETLHTLFDKKYGEGFYEKNPLVLYWVVQPDIFGIKTYHDWIDYYQSFRSEYLDFCDRRDIDSDDKSSIRLFYQKKFAQKRKF